MEKDVMIFWSILAVLLVAAIILCVKYLVAYKKIYKRFKDVIDVEKEAEKTQVSLNKLKDKFNQLDKDFQVKSDELNAKYQEKRNIYEQLLKEINSLEEDLEFTTMGVYKPHYDFDTSEAYKVRLEEIRDRQKQMIKDKKATVCDAQWEVRGSKREGSKMTYRYLKLMLRAFNGECDAAVLKVRWNNIINMEKRLEKSFEAINELGSVISMRITRDYYELKSAELRLAYEYQEKKHEEKEEERRIKEEMREEEKLREEIEKAQEEAEADEKRYGDALEKAREEISRKQGEELEKLKKKIEELEKNLLEARQKKERAISRAQMTKSGYIYVISNVGSFGENIYKIGLTRRLEPMDRIRELGDASVPFQFDVHAMIFSENAPSIEHDIQEALENKRINMVNSRKEFFNASLDEIEDIVKKKGWNIEFMRIAEAKEYRQTLAMHEQEKNKKIIEKRLEKFPASLN